MRKVDPTGGMMVARGIYRRWLHDRFSKLTLAGLAPDDQPLLLRQIYVPLNLTEEPYRDTVEEEKLKSAGPPLEGWLERIEGWEGADGGPYQANFWSAPQTLLVAGEPGSGKTTLTHAVVVSLAGEVADSFNERFSGLLPIPIILRSVPSGKLSSLDTVIDWWLAQVEGAGSETFDRAALRRFLDEGWAILIFDGLDEIGDLEARQKFARSLRGHRWLGGRGKGPANFCLVTARPSGFDGLRAEDLPEHKRLHAAPFSQAQIKTYLERYFALRPARTGEDRQTAELLYQRLTSAEENDRLLPLARRPAYLTSLCFVHGTRGQLPYTRAELYGLLVDAYLEVLDQQRELSRPAGEPGVTSRARNWNRQDKLQVLSTVAFLAHDRAEGEGGKVAALRWTHEELVAVVAEAIELGAERLREIKPGKEEAKELTNYFVARTGLISEVEEGVFQFAHLSFQEYLAALLLLAEANACADKAEFLERELFGERIARATWYEVAMLLLAVDGLQTQNQGQGRIFARLDLGKDAHFEVLTRVLEGEEIKLSLPLRQALVGAWWGAAASPQAWGRVEAVERLMSQPANRDYAEATWRLCLEAALSSADLEPALLQGLAPGDKARKGLFAHQAEAPAEIAGPLLSRLPWLAREPAKAVALMLPLIGGHWSVDLAGEVGRLANLELFAAEAGALRVREPRPLFFVFEAWSWGQEELLRLLAAKVPFGWLVVDDELAGKVGQLEKTDAWQEWQLQQLGRWRELEGLFLVLALGAEPANQRRLGSSIWAGRALALARARSRSRSRSRALARSRSRALARARALDLDLALFRARALARALARDLARARARNRALDRDLDLARAMARARDRALALARDLALEQALESRLATALTPLSAGAFFWEKATEEEGDRAALAASWLLIGLADAPYLLRQNQGRVCNRQELEERFRPLIDPAPTAAFFADPAERERALFDHRELLACQWSPQPLFDAIFEDESWQEIDLSPEALVSSFEKTIAPIVAAVESRPSPRKGRKSSPRKPS